MTAQAASRLTVYIEEHRPLAKDIVGLTLRATDNTPLPAATPGAHIDLFLANGMTRQYSIVNATAQSYELGVLLDPASRGGSDTIHHKLHQGATLEISPPRNLFPLDTAAQHVILFAGGIGITPILSMANALHRSKTPFTLIYCSRSKERAAYLDQLNNAPYRDNIHIFHDDESDTNAFNAPSLLATIPQKTPLYVCGPNGFMDHILTAAQNAGWATQDLHSERFSAPQSDTTDDGSFEIVIKSSGAHIHVAAEETAVSALQNAGYDIPMSCEQGICGTCLIPVLDGELDHRDMFMTDAERSANNRFTPCCSRGKGRLTLDL